MAKRSLTYGIPPHQIKLKENPRLKKAKQIVEDLGEVSREELIGMILRQQEELEFLKSQKAPVKKDIRHFLEAVFGETISNKILVDLSEDVNTIGRPSVLGSSTKQMRHVTPFCFLEQLISTQVLKTKDPKTILNLLVKSAHSIFHYEGICLDVGDFRTINFSPKFHIVKLATELPPSSPSKPTIESTCFLIDKPQEVLLTPTKAKLFSSPSKSSTYKSTHSLFIDHSLEKLQGSIPLHDTNTLTIASELVTRYIFTHYNKQPNTCFPEEGNTTGYEIRLYNTKQTAKTPVGKKYTIVTAEELQGIIVERGIDYVDSRIRIVNNEGAQIKKIVAGIDLLNKIATEAFISDSEEEDVESYNKNYKFQLKLPNNPNADFLEPLNQSLVPGIEAIVNQVVKLLYLAFDYKPLENKVLVYAEEYQENKVITVYPTATGTKTKYYKIEEGSEFREREIKLAKGYNKKVEFRQEEVNYKTLAELAISHVYLSIMSFSGLMLDDMPGKILQAFTKLLSLSYQINYIELSTLVNKLDLTHHKLAEEPSNMTINSSWLVTMEDSAYFETSIPDILGNIISSSDL